MLKRMLFAAAVTGLVAGATIPVHTTSAEAAPQRVLQGRQGEVPGRPQGPRHAYRKECKTHWKAYKTAQRAAKKAA